MSNAPVIDTAVPPQAQALYERHRETLTQAVSANAQRGYWSAYPEMPKAYGEEAAKAGEDAFAADRGNRFGLEQPATDGWEGEERSPFGFELGITYPHADLDQLLAQMSAAIALWRDAGPDVRAGVCLEILAKINERSHEIAHAVMHTTGQAFAMAFQAGGPHAQDRALEAVAYAYAEMTRHAARARWEKPQGKRPPLVMEKRFNVVPRGIALVVGCNTFPTWNSYPGLFASLATGNAVLVKPARRAVLPLAITVAVAREVLAEAGFSPDLVALAVERPDERLASTLAVRPEVRIIDYTGSTEFGEWLEANAPQAVVFTEKAGVNTIVLDSTDDYKGMLGNIAFTLSLYSGQMCTTTQNILVPRGGIETDQGHKDFDAVAEDLGKALDGLLGDDARANAILGAIGSPEILDRIERAQQHGRVVRASRAVANAEFPEATVRTPALIALDAGADEQVYLTEQFGPITFLIATDDTEHSLELLRSSARDHGAITAGVYSTSDAVLEQAERAAIDGMVALSCNLTGAVYVNQSAAFSDFHATGGNPAANSTLSDGAFVASRFRIVQSRRHVAPDEQ
ncbi:MAG: phenylacetic acid degradation protein PaaN [Solirubrobacteraceae bacterium]|jgi:phenylacetic acid degradation protein paaN